MRRQRGSVCLSSLKRSRDAVRGGGHDDQIAFATRFKLDVRVLTAANCYFVPPSTKEYNYGIRVGQRNSNLIKFVANIINIYVFK